MLTTGALLFAWLAAGQVQSDAGLSASAATIAGDAFRLTGVRSHFQITADGLRGQVSIDAVELTKPAYRIEQLELSCARLRLTNRAAYCDAGSITATLPALGRRSLAGTYAWSTTNAQAAFALEMPGFAGTLLRLEGYAGAADYDVGFAGTDLELATLLETITQFSAALDDFTGSGPVTLEGTLSGTGAGGTTLALRAATNGVSVANASGTLATERLQGELHLDFTIRDEQARLDLELRATGGEAYLEPAYFDLSAHALLLVANDVGTSDFTTFEVPSFRVTQAPLLDVTGRARLGLPAEAETATTFTGDIELTETSVRAVYDGLLKFTMAGTVFGNLATDGRVTGKVTISNNVPTSARLELDDVTLDDNDGRFAVYGLNGNVDWPGTGQPAAAVSNLRWAGAAAYGIPFGAAAVGLRLGPAGGELLETLRIATMGGALRINELAIHDFGSEKATGALDADLESVELGQLTTALGWPAFSGQLSGHLPLMRLSDDAVTVGGTLTATAFDGTIEVGNLRIEQPFGRVPRLQADVRLRGLDLERLTNVFSFGEIEGRLSGDVTGLRMAAWRTVAMDLHLYTPPGDRSRHRISQRAVENIASIGGGGAGAALSSGLLRFFDVFAYDRIGLRCVLRDGVCTMSGAGPAGSDGGARGYYIVKGKGVPRIDVVGYREKVSWPRLVRQLEDITRRGPAKVE